MRSGPFELGEDGVGVRDHSSIVENELVLEGVVVGHVDDCGAAQLFVELTHQFDLPLW